MEPDPLASWSSFFAAVANAGAALVGLVFVSVSIQLGRHRLDRRTWALGTMAVVDLFHPVLAALGMLLPIALEARGAALLVLAAGGLWASASIGRVHRRRASGESRLLATYRYYIPAGAVVILTASAAGLLVGERRGVYGIATFIAVMLIVGTQNAWDLLMGTRIGQPDASLRNARAITERFPGSSRSSSRPVTGSRREWSTRDLGGSSACRSVPRGPVFFTGS